MERRPRPKQLNLPVTYRWGGRRAGTGRKPTGELGGRGPNGKPRPGVSHRRRVDIEAVVPLHVTVRAAPSLRVRKVAAAVGALLKRRATRRAVDAFSSAAWFGGFADHPPLRTDPAPVVPARHWLLEKGWRARAGRIRPEERPRS